MGKHIINEAGYRKSSLIDRFWRRTIKKSDNECWEWIGSVCTNGYGQLFRAKQPGIQAHRFSWEIHYGKIPDRLWVLHKCDNRRCVNPNHLFLGTRQDNVDDMVRKKRNVHLKGESHPRAKLTETNVIDILKLDKIGQYSRSEIAQKLSLNYDLVSAVIAKRNWKWIKLP